jgi:DNA-binding NarL/FixJ family response regulator
MMDLTKAEQLTSRQQEVLRLMGEGESPKAIAAVLGLSVKTVDIHIARMKEKLAVRDGLKLRAFATRWLVREGK